MQTRQEPLAVAIRDAARLMGISESKLEKLLAEGEGPASFRIGRRRLIRVSVLKKWLSELEAAELRAVADPPAA